MIDTIHIALTLLKLTNAQKIKYLGHISKNFMVLHITVYF